MVNAEARWEDTKVSSKLPAFLATDSIPPTQLSATISPNLTPFVDELKNQAWRQVNGVDSILTEPHPNFATIKV